MRPTSFSPTSADSGLDAGSVSDDEYLAELGYRSELSRVLGKFSSFALQYSTIGFVGALLVGFTIGLAQVGPLSVVVWFVATGLQVIVAMCVAELCSAYPLAGGAYQIVSRLHSRALGWQIGWWVQIAHIASVSSATIGITPFIMSWFGVDNLTHWQLVGISAVLIVLSTIANLLGVRIVSWLNNVSVVAELAGAAVIVLGLGGAFIFSGHSHAHAFHYLFTTQGTVKGSVVLPLLYASLLSVYIVSAFDVSGTAGEETKNAANTVPTTAVAANRLSWIVGTVVLLMLTLGIKDLGAVLGSGNPVGAILTSNISSVVATLFTAMACFALWVNAVILQLAGARVIWAQARDGRFPAAKLFSRLNKEKIPYAGILLGGVIAFLTTIYSDLFVVLIALLAIGWAAAYAVLLVIGFRAKLRNELPQHPYTPRMWKVLYPVAIGWSVLFCVVLIYQDPRHVGLGALGAAILGLIVYYVLVPKQDAPDRSDSLGEHPNGPDISADVRGEVSAEVRTAALDSAG
jgi:amino acid transporter